MYADGWKVPKVKVEQWGLEHWWGCHNAMLGRYDIRYKNYNG
jgi:hypothetical protein